MTFPLDTPRRKTTSHLEEQTRKSTLISTFSMESYAWTLSTPSIDTSVNTLLQNTPEDVLSSASEDVLKSLAKKYLGDLLLPRIWSLRCVFDAMERYKRSKRDTSYRYRRKQIIKELKIEFPECVTILGQGSNVPPQSETEFRIYTKSGVYSCKVPEGADYKYHGRLVKFFHDQGIDYGLGIDVIPLSEF